MRAVAAVLLAASVALAEPPGDAPLADLPGRSVHLATGQPAPFSGRLLADAEHVASEWVAADDHAFRKQTEGKLMLSPVALVAIVAGALAVGAGVAAGVAIATRRP